MVVAAYPSIDDVLAFFDTEPKGKRLERLDTLLTVATDELVGELGGYDFRRNPSTGFRTSYLDTDGRDLVHAHRGIVGLDSVEISLDQGATFETLETTEYRLQGSFDSADDPLEGEPWFHLRLLPYGTWRRFPRGTGLVRVSWATGWPTIPSPAIEGIAERARQIAFADPSYSGEIPADDDFGRPVSSSRWPDVTWKFLQRERQRFMACSL